MQVSATLPQNYIAFEYPVARPAWWYDIVTGLPNPIVKNSLIEVWDRPGLGVEFVKDKKSKEQDIVRTFVKTRGVMGLASDAWKLARSWR